MGEGKDQSFPHSPGREPWRMESVVCSSASEACKREQFQSMALSAVSLYFLNFSQVAHAYCKIKKKKQIF